MAAKAKVLIVEDEALLRQHLKAMLQQDGYELLEAASLAELRSFLQGPAPQALLLDLWLPDGSGLSALPEVKRNWPSCRVVILTGHATVQTAEEAYLMHDVFLLTKPLDMGMLKTVLDLAQT